MPIEIREVVIKAQLEKKLFDTGDQQNFSEEKILQLKEEIIAEMMEKMEEKLWSMPKR